MPLCLILCTIQLRVFHYRYQVQEVDGRLGHPERYQISSLVIPVPGRGINSFSGCPFVSPLQCEVYQCEVYSTRKGSRFLQSSRDLALESVLWRPLALPLLCALIRYSQPQPKKTMVSFSLPSRDSCYSSFSTEKLYCESQDKSTDH